MPKKSLPTITIENLETATFECTFGRGCEGICCRNGRPSVASAEMMAMEGVLPRVLPRLRPDARKLVEEEGFVSRRTKVGQPMLRVSGGWCVFFNEGCVLHQVGAEDGDSYQYKPIQCALFPVEHDDDGSWYVRQKGHRGEQWDLFCLNPKQSPKPAAETLAAEIALAQRVAGS